MFRCGLPAVATKIERKSEQVDYVIKIVRKRTVRPVFRPSCQCGLLPKLIQHPLPSRAFPRSLYSINFWIELLLTKYAYQIPLNVWIGQIAEHGLPGVKAPTLCRGIEHAFNLLLPLYQAIKLRNQQADRWRSDETSLAVFIVREGRETFNYYLWQYQSADTVVFVFCPTRGGEHPREFSENCAGIVNVDRAKAFQTLHSEMILAFCWAHVRRDFITIGRYQRGHRTWAVGYTRLIKRIYRQNRKRLQCSDENERKVEQARLEKDINDLKRKYQAELKKDKLPDNRRKALTSLKNHWDGLTVFVNHPEVPMDNNQAERKFRDVARFRHNCYGVFSEKFGVITAAMLTIFATLRQLGIPLRPYLNCYFEAASANNGQAPEGLKTLLPWNLPESVQRRIFTTASHVQFDSS